MTLHPIPKTLSRRTLQRQYRTVLNGLKASRGAVLLMHHQTPEAVLLDIEAYNALVGDDYTYDTAHVARLVAEARASYRKGKTKILRSWNELDR